MTERPSSIEPAEPPRPRESAVGMLLRPGARGGVELLVGLRSRRSRFLPGHWACLGGALEPQDRPDEPGAYARCAAREMLEETGISIDVGAWHSAGVLVTPPFFPLRYRTEFFVSLAERDLDAPDPPPRPEEIEALRFAEPDALLAEWARGEVLLPPILPPQLRALARADSAPVETVARQLIRAHEDQERCHRIEFVPGIWMLPLRSLTLPPATHTNCWMPGGRRFVVVDPGSAEPDELERLVRVIRRREREGSRVEAIVLTHHHADHSAGARLLGEELELPVLGHRETLERVPRLTRVEALGEGDRIDLDGAMLEVWHTPGHAPGHLAVIATEHRSAIVGDLLSGLSTIVIDPAEGSMELYCASLRRLADAGLRRLFPSHGPPLPGRAAASALEHRARRAEQVLSALDGQPRPISEIAREAYADTPGAPEPLIGVQTSAILRELARLERAVEIDGGWARP